MRLFIVVIFVCLTSCLHRGDRIEKEQGIVLSKSMTPGYYHTYTRYHRQYYGRSYNGRRQYVNVPTNETYYVSPVYTVKFKCQHQKVFYIHREDVYKNLNDLDTVTIEFYNMLDGKEQIKDYDFITAYKQKNKTDY